jgi:protein phosphatase-4 regulatory subunit 3
MLNDNGILEYILHDDVFEGVIGMLEYDPDYPSLKASFRQFFREISRFRQVVEIKDTAIRNKIHQTYRLQYLKEVVLARLLDDPTFGILNGFIFFNQVDIIGHIQNNDALLIELFAAFGADESGAAGSADPPPSEEVTDQRRRDTVLFLHQLMLMGKSIQMPTRLALYRNLLDRGLLGVLEWAFKRQEAPIVHAAAEMLTLVTEHDVVAVRGYIVRDDEAKRGRTLVTEIITLFRSSPNLGLLSQLTDTMRTLLEPPAEADSGVSAGAGAGRPGAVRVSDWLARCAHCAGCCVCIRPVGLMRVGVPAKAGQLGVGAVFELFLRPLLRRAVQAAVGVA